jgi:alpha-D-xyloside xylohydrolase
VSEGGATITVAAALDRIPVFLRDGARLPITGPAAKDR